MTRGRGSRLASGGLCSITPSSGRAQGEQGQIVLLAALAITAMLGILALAVDLGYAYSQRRAAQKAADAGAWAAALALTDFGADKARADARYYARINGFDDDGVTNSVTVNIPPASPPAKQAYDGSYVQVIITKRSGGFFSGVAGFLNLDVGARAVAASNQFNNYTLFVMDRTASPALSLGNSTSVQVNGGSVVVNSSATGTYGAIKNDGTLVAATRIDSVGTYTGSGSASPTPTRISVPVADPFASTPQPYYDASYKVYRLPDGTALTDRSGSYQTASTMKPLTSTTMYPGTYWGGFRLNSSSVTVRMEPGVYVMAGGGSGGGFFANGGTIEGTGITIYNTQAPEMTPTPDRQPGDINLGGNTILNLQAPTSGTYAGMLLFQDPNNTKTASLSGGATTNLVGTIYIPNAAMDLGGSGSMTLTLQMVVKLLTVSGSNNITINMPTNRYIPPGPSLVE